MRGFDRFLRKEFIEIVRTWRLPVVAGVLLFFALTGPVIALMTPELLKSVGASQPGVVIQVPDPTWRDAYAQWTKNLAQIIPFIVLILGAGSVAGETASGTGILVLTKPVSRTAFVIAKALAYVGLVHLTVVAATALTQALTYVVFDEAPGAPLWGAVAVWLTFSVLLVAIGVLFSTMMPTLAAAGAGVGAFFVLSLAALWGPALKYSPAGALPAVGDLLLGKDAHWVWPSATSVGLAVLLVALAAVVFRRREL